MDMFDMRVVVGIDNIYKMRIKIIVWVIYFICFI